MRTPRRGSAGLKILGCWVLFIAGAVAGLMAMGHSPEDLFDALLSKTTGVVLDEMASRGMLPPPVDSKDVSVDDVDSRLVASREELDHQNAQESTTQKKAGSVSRTRVNRTSRRVAPKQADRLSDSGYATLKYWNRINEIVAREAEMRAAPSKVTSGNAGSFVAARLRAFRYAGTALRGMRARNVDPEVVAHAQQLIDWYEEGAEINQHAMHLLTEATQQSRQGSEGRGWQDSEKAHYRGAQRLNQNGRELRQRMSQRYGVDFPPLL